MVAGLATCWHCPAAFSSCCGDGIRYPQERQTAPEEVANCLMWPFGAAFPMKISATEDSWFSQALSTWRGGAMAQENMANGYCSMSQGADLFPEHSIPVGVA